MAEPDGRLIGIFSALGLGDEVKGFCGTSSLHFISLYIFGGVVNSKALLARGGMCKGSPDLAIRYVYLCNESCRVQGGWVTGGEADGSQSPCGIWVSFVGDLREPIFF